MKNDNISCEVVENNKIDNESFALIKVLKADIKVLTESYTKRKREGYQDRCVSQEIRAHLIAYCVLRGKSYKEMEKKCSEFNPIWWDWRTLIRNVNKVCLKYSLADTHENWAVQNIEQIITEARTND